MSASSISSVSDRLVAAKREVKEISADLSRKEGWRDMLQHTLSTATQEIHSINDKLNYMKLIEVFLAQFADERQASVYRQLEATVSEGLQTVFGEDIRLVVSNKMVGSRSETVFTIVSPTPDGELETSIMDARGGGVAAIVGFLIQAVLVLLTPGMRPILFLDESFRNVSAEYQEPLSKFIRDLCDRTGLQVVLVTHQPAIAEYATTWYSFKQKDGQTTIKKEL